MNWTVIITNTLTLLILMDPIGNSPLLHTLLQPVKPERRRHVLRRELLFVLLFLSVFYFLGQKILGYMGIQESTLNMAGGFMLLLIAIGMVFPRVSILSASSQQAHEEDQEPLIVPIAVPCMIGPASIAFVMLKAAEQHDTSALLGNGVFIFLAWTITALVLQTSGRLLSKLGQRGSVAVTRLMGTLLVLLAIQMCLNGLSVYMEDFLTRMHFLPQG